jgi:hypothetical protein
MHFLSWCWMPFCNPAWILPEDLYQWRLETFLTVPDTMTTTRSTKVHPTKCGNDITITSQAAASSLLHLHLNTEAFALTWNFCKPSQGNFCKPSQGEFTNGAQGLLEIHKHSYLGGGGCCVGIQCFSTRVHCPFQQTSSNWTGNAIQRIMLLWHVLSTENLFLNVWMSKADVPGLFNICCWLLMHHTAVNQIVQ